MAASPQTSAGAREERRQMRRYLRRRLSQIGDGGRMAADEIARLLEWLSSRQARYDTKPGGLGKR